MHFHPRLAVCANCGAALPASLEAAVRCTYCAFINEPAPEPASPPPEPARRAVVENQRAIIEEVARKQAAMAVRRMTVAVLAAIMISAAFVVFKIASVSRPHERLEQATASWNDPISTPPVLAVRGVRLRSSAPTWGRST